ncbi:MAG: class I SAM-dependent methyltransferase [Reichenbachiella sp.]
MDEHSLQGPYIYGLYKRILKPKNHVVAPTLKQLRKSLSENDNSILQQHGAYSNQHKNTRISQIVKSGISDVSESNLLKSLATSIDASNVLELGTSVGLNAIVMTANSPFKLVSVEVDTALFAIATKVVSDAGLSSQIELINNDAEVVLLGLKQQRKCFDLIYIDANHTYEATRLYFQLASEILTDNGIMVFDDINWSLQMNTAWSDIKKTISSGVIVENFNKGIWIKSESRKKEYILDF